MSSTTTIKRSPIVLIRTLVAIEALAFLAYFFAGSFDTYKYDIYSNLFISRFFSYDTLKFLVLSAAQLAITVYGFLEWYYESYSITPTHILHRKGVFFKKETKFPLRHDMSTTFVQNSFSKLAHYGTIRVVGQENEQPILLKDISRPETLSEILDRTLHPENGHEVPDIESLLIKEESDGLEFKSSLRFDHKTGAVNRELEKVVMKTVAAFLNSHGGHVVIGVDDTRTPLGLQVDYQTLNRPNSDGFEHHFTQIFNAMIGPEFRYFVKLWFAKASEQDVCVVSVAPSVRPVYVRHENQEHFYIRTGNVTTPLKLSSAETYTRSRWPVKEI